MTQSLFYAHSTDKKDKSDWQLLKDHLLSVGKMAAENATPFGGDTFAYIAGILHDLGKYTEEFQLRLCGKSKVDHATWGAKIACKQYGERLGKIIAYGVAGHHAGLANGRDGENRTSLDNRLKKINTTLLPQWENEIILPLQINPPSLRPNKNHTYFQFSFFTRMLFSCLVDADFIDTEAFYNKIAGKKVARSADYSSLTDLRNQLHKYLNQFQQNTTINKIRMDILKQVCHQSTQLPGLFSLNVPTGGGKTLSSLAFALDHAIWHGQRRIIYVIPFTSIVEQNAAVFIKALQPLGEHNVLEHHSAYVDDKAKAPEAREKLHLAMENWDAPIIVTTAVQFFESLFAARPSRCRKLHNIANSVIILDEAQTLPLKLLHPCVAAIKELALNYRCSLVLCTATQPALQVDEGFCDGFEQVYELAPDPKLLQQQLKRVHVHHIGKLNDEELVAQYFAKNQQILCIVNNRSHARSLGERMKNLSGVYHLTTLMCAKHRSEILTEIRQKLRDGKDCRVISTSLIEAGVDIDFPLVLRAEAGLDAIAQAAGRCNREGRRSPEDSAVLIFEVGSDWKTPAELKQFAQAARSILRQYKDPLSGEAIKAYFRELYWQKGDGQLGMEMLKLIEEGQLDNLPFETLAEQFRIIDSPMRPIIIPYDIKAKNLLNKFAYVESCGKIARDLQPYLVQVPEQGLLALKLAGAIEAIQPAKFGEQFMRLINVDLYDKDYGIRWDDPTFMQAEHLVL